MERLLRPPCPLWCPLICLRAVELLPVFEYDELEFQRRWGLPGGWWLVAQPALPAWPRWHADAASVCPVTVVCAVPDVTGAWWPAPASLCCCSANPRDHMVNVWGYSHLNFFAPMSRFGSGACGRPP